jgi:hypothetical protein
MNGAVFELPHNPSKLSTSKTSPKPGKPGFLNLFFSCQRGYGKNASSNLKSMQWGQTRLIL